MNGARWTAMGTSVHLVVRDGGALPEAVAILQQQLDELDAACSRFRDSELTRLRPGRTPLGPVLRDAVAAALEVARLTDGLVDPTLGRALRAAGYDRTFADLPAEAAPPGPAAPGRWQELHLNGNVLTLPDVELDLGATAKAWAADRAAMTIAARLGSQALVNLGGDLACVGEWRVAVGDPGGPAEVVAVTGGLATSSTLRRRWRAGGCWQHHVLDPRTGRPAEPCWDTVTVAAATCLEANAAATAAVVLGREAPQWLAGLPARLVAGQAVTRTSTWPQERAA